MAAITVAQADYADRFDVHAPGSHMAEAWARAAFEPASPTESKQLVWRRVLQLRLGPLDDPGRVAGWAIEDRADERLVLVAESWHLRARLVFEADGGHAQVTTEVTYRRLAGRLLWSAVGPVHRRAVPDILAAAARRLEESAALPIDR